MCLPEAVGEEGRNRERVQVTLISICGWICAGKLLVLILVTGVGVVALLVIAFGVIPQSKR